MKFNKIIKIGNIEISESSKIFIIAEAGVNHNGSFKIAKKMIDTAVEAGADAIKFQTFKTGNIITGDAKKAEYQIANTGSRESQYEMLKKLELKGDDFRQLANYAKEKNIVFLSSSFDKDSVDLLYRIGVPMFKIASGEITNLPLIKYIARKGKPIILSTGMSNLKEIKEALNIIRNEGIREIILLHCVTNYPAEMKEVNLKAIQTLRNVFKIPVGLSDHTIGITIPIAAVAMGACLVEKHFTLNKNFPGPDHQASLEPHELKEMIKAIREVEEAMGDGVKKPTKNEEKIKKIVRRSIVANVDMAQGTQIKADMLSIKRPGTGIHPKYLSRVVGKIARRGIKKDQVLTWQEVIL